MNTGVKLQIETYGYDTGDVPVKIEILDGALRLVQEGWLRANETREFPLEPGVYSVRASVPSGQVMEKVLPVEQGKVEVCSMPLHEASPHESQEWAYLTQSINAPGEETLSDTKYHGAWIRLWERTDAGTWKLRPFPTGDDMRVESIEDGVRYDLQALGSGFYALQVGGPQVPWKIVALPSTYHVLALVRPVSAPSDQVHPLEVVVSTDNWQVESLLSLMQRGDMSGANDLVEKTELAETLLYSKMQDSNAAAVGGYFLLRVGSIKRLHDWANNLDSFFPWLPDGAVIHAWQLMREVKRDQNRDGALFDEARQRMLEAVRRGFPLYTEGLRLLRDGLIMLDQRAKGKDQDIRQALDEVGRYAAAADWSVSNTTFTGKTPDKPSTNLKQGTPSERESLVYVYDVPIRAAIQQGLIQPGEELVVDLPEGRRRSKVSDEGTLELEDGRTFQNLGELQAALTGKSSGAWQQWRQASSDTDLGDIVQNLRLKS